uniref:Uncharacterized protein n=1 Tax=Oryza sativa subsp. japonica TaxID=39947 RepID=Q6Z5C9_ORYSJ|nr:hypothetical protein [Oryza sativa Japonica Group]
MAQHNLPHWCSQKESKIPGSGTPEVACYLGVRESRGKEAWDPHGITEILSLSNRDLQRTDCNRQLIISSCLPLCFTLHQVKLTSAV